MAIIEKNKLNHALSEVKESFSDRLCDNDANFIIGFLKMD